MKSFSTCFCACIIFFITLFIPLKGIAKEDKRLFMATTTSVVDTGLLDYLAPKFHADTGYLLQFVAVGTGEALAMGKNGDVDLVLTHAKTYEDAFVKKGFGVKRVPIMYNDFIVIGPKVPLAPTQNTAELFTALFAQELPFISRGDKSGTHIKEESIWKSVHIDPSGNPHYMESGQGMGATVGMADEKNAYTLTDRGTWLKISTDAHIKSELTLVCEGDKSLFNQYALIAVHPAKYPKTNIKGADAFIEWMVSPHIQKIIGEFGLDAYGQALFMPNANSSRAVE